MIVVNKGESLIEGLAIEITTEFAQLYGQLIEQCPEVVYASVMAYDDELKEAVSDCSEITLDFSLFVAKKIKEGRENEKH